MEEKVNKSFKDKIDSYFKIKERGSTVKIEILAGITTFITMAYILMVNAGMLGSLNGASYGSIYIATAISAVVGTILIGLLANLPLAQASGMGLNAFFVYTVCYGFGLTYANALILVLLDGIVFVILTVTGLRKKIFKAIPKTIRIAIPAGIGLFIAFLGLQNAGIVVNDDATLVNLVSMNFLSGDPEGVWARVMPVICCLSGFIAITVLSKKEVKGATLWGIVGATALYYLLGLTVKGFYDNTNANYFLGITDGVANKLDMNPLSAFKDFGTMSFGAIFKEGFNFSVYLANHSGTSLVLVIATSILAFCIVDMFDTIGTLYGACARGNLLTEEGEIPNMDKAMFADSIATCVGAVCGTSTVTTFVESSAGVGEGGRTGFAAMVTALCFFIAMFLSPIAQLIPSCATATALIYVGVLMMGSVKDVLWDDIAEAVPAFVTMVIMVLTYNISYGIGLGIITYSLVKLFTGKAKEVSIVTWIIALMFALTFFLTH